MCLCFSTLHVLCCTHNTYRFARSTIHCDFVNLTEELWSQVTVPLSIWHSHLCKATGWWPKNIFQVQFCSAQRVLPNMHTDAARCWGNGPEALSGTCSFCNGLRGAAGCSRVAVSILEERLCRRRIEARAQHGCHLSGTILLKMPTSRCQSKATIRSGVASSIWRYVVA